MTQKPEDLLKEIRDILQSQSSKAAVERQETAKEEEKNEEKRQKDSMSKFDQIRKSFRKGLDLLSNKIVLLGVAGLTSEVESLRKSAFLIQKEYRDVGDKYADVLSEIPGTIFFNAREIVDAQRVAFRGFGKHFLNLSKENRVLTGSVEALHGAMHSVTQTVGQNNGIIETLSKAVAESAAGYDRATVDLLNGIRQLLGTVGDRIGAMGGDDKFLTQVLGIMDRTGSQVHRPLIDSIEILTRGLGSVAFQARFGFREVADRLLQTGDLTGDLIRVTEMFGEDLESYQNMFPDRLGFTAALPSFMGLSEQQINSLRLLRDGLRTMEPKINTNGKKLDKHGKTLQVHAETLRTPMAKLTDATLSLASHMSAIVPILSWTLPALLGAKMMPPGFGWLGVLGGTALAGAASIWGGTGLDPEDPTQNRIAKDTSKIEENTAKTAERLRNERTGGFNTFTGRAAELIDEALREQIFRGTELEEANRVTQDQYFLLREMNGHLRGIFENGDKPFG